MHLNINTQKKILFLYVRMGRNTRRMKRGGGWAHGPPLSAETYYFPERQAYNDCYAQARPGAIESPPNPNLAQIGMAGGSRYTNCHDKTLPGLIQSNPKPNLAQIPMAGGKRLSRRNRSRKGMRGGCGCGLRRGGGRKTRRGRKVKRGGCGCGVRRIGGRRTMRGGRYGFDVSTSIGDDGPNVAPTIAHVPCEGHHPTPLNPTIATMLSNAPNPDLSVGGLRPAFIQTGGMMPGNSGHPLAYTEPTATYSFVPNISQGAALNPGMVPYQEVVPAPTSCISDCDAAIKAISGK